MLYIKGFDKDLKCRDFQFEVGREYKIDNNKPLELCTDSVFHFCKTLEDVHTFYPCYKKYNNRFCYIEALSEVVEDGYKLGCSHIKIIREIVGNRLNQLLGSVNGNTGLFNSGNENSGNRNTGDCNSGDWDSGNENSGDYNSGYGNSGDCNSGYGNSGYGNSGDCNSGYRNSGNRNSGYGNSGNRNSGNENSGIFSSCNYSTGVFCNKQDTIKIFNIDSGMTMEEFRYSKYYKALFSTNFELNKWDEDQQKTVSVDYKEACKNWWDNIAEKNKEIILSMPNFDPEVFEDITGIKV